MLSFTTQKESYNKLSIGSKTIRSASFMILSGYSSIVVSFLGNLVLARILIPDDFGVYALAGSILTLVFMFAGFGSQEAIVQNRDDTLPNLIPTAFLISVGIAFVLALLGSAIGLLIAVTNTYRDPIPQFIIVLAWAKLLANVGYVYSFILQRNFNFKIVAILQFANTLISFIVAVICAFIGFGAWALIIREITDSIISFLGCILLSKYSIKLAFDWGSARAIWTFGWKLMITRISEVVFGRFDNFMVGTFLGTVALGHYSLAYRLNWLGSQFTQSVIQPVVFSAFAAMQHSPHQIQYSTNRLLFWLFRASGLMGIGVLLFGSDLVVLIYGQQWEQAGIIFQNMWLFLAILPIHEAVQHILIGVGYINKVVKSRMIMLVTFIPALVIATLRGDIIMVAWAVNLSLLLSTMLMLGYIRRLIAVRWLYLIRNPMISAIGTILAVGVLRTLFVAEIYSLGILIFGVLTVILYSIMLILLEYASIRTEFRIIRLKLK